MVEMTVHLVTLNNSGTGLLERKTCGFHSLPTLLSFESSPYSYWDTGVTSGNSVPRTLKRNSMPVKVHLMMKHHDQLEVKGVLLLEICITVHP